MKRVIIIVCCVFSFVSCNDGSVPKPDNLIAKEKMIDILYDISLLEAIKAINIMLQILKNIKKCLKQLRKN